MAKEKIPRPPVWLVLGAIYGAFLGFAAIILRTGGYDWSFYGAEALITTVVGAFIGLIVGMILDYLIARGRERKRLGREWGLFKGSDWTSKAGFFFSLPMWAWVSFAFVVSFSDTANAAFSGLLLPSIVAIPCVLMLVPIAIVFASIGISRRRTRFAWVALFSSIAPTIAMFLALVFVSTF